jgi:PAS domain S-box-containing protein
MATKNRVLDRRPKVTAIDLGPDNWRLLRTVVDTSPECIKVVAFDGQLLQINAAGLRMIDAASFDIVDGVSVIELIAPEHRQFWREKHERVCRGETLCWQFDIIGLAGVRRHMETKAVPISLSDGTVGQLAFTHDVTARQNELLRARQRLQETERGFELLIESVTDYAIYMLDPEGRVVSWNGGARRITGYEEDEIIGRHVSCFYTEEDRLAGLPIQSLQTAASEGKIEKDGWRVRKDGTRFFANVIIDAIRDGERLIGFAKITRDITEKRAAEQRLRQAQKMEAIGQFTGGAAHDFRNLLTAISGSLELLRKQLPTDPRTLGLLDTAVQASRRGITLTQRMLSFARRQELKIEAVDVVALVFGMLGLLERSVGPAIRIDTRFLAQIPPALTDANQLETALLNLALNAKDAMPSGGTITITADNESVTSGHPSHLAPGSYTRISFTDTGHGMDEATLARVTEPFFTTKGVGKGTGLGLAMVDGLCAQSGGKLVVRSRLYQGTTLELWLPAAAGELRASPSTSTAEPLTAATADRQLKVLLVDDDTLVLESTTAMLEDLGHIVLAVPSGERALDLIKDASIDVVITDQGMPGISGLELAGAIRAVRPNLPVLIATGNAELLIGGEGTNMRLIKPYTQQQLADAAASCVGAGLFHAPHEMEERPFPNTEGR